MARESLRLRDAAANRALRPIAGADEYNSALRSEYTYIDGPLGKEETFLNSEAKGYDSVVLTFSPADVITRNPYVPYNVPTAFSIVRSPAGFPTTSLDGYTVATYDFVGAPITAVISNIAGTTNVATITTNVAHGLVVGDIVRVLVTSVANSVLSVSATVLSVPTTTTFTYAYPGANVTSAAGTGTIWRYGSTTPIPTDGKVLVTDNGLLPGQFYYYALFARYFDRGNTYWLRVAISETLVPTNHGYSDRLWDHIPEHYRRLDVESIGNYTNEGVLRRYIDVLGYEVDTQRTWIESVGDVWDVQRLNSRLLPYLGGNVLGLSNEAVVGDKRYRNLLSNIMYLRRFSGTKDGIEGYLAALTGYKTIVYVGKNIYLSNDDVEMRNGSGNWTAATVNVAMTRVAGSGAETGGPTLGTQFFHTLTNSTGGSANGVYRYGGVVFDPRASIPVVGGSSYRMQVMVRQSAVGTVTPTIDWYTSAGVFISTSTEGIAIGTTTGWTTVVGATMVAPSNAAYAIPKWTATSMANTGTIKFWRNMIVDLAWAPLGIPAAVGQTPSTTYESARLVYINLYPQRTNFAINADFASNPGTFPAQGWTTTDPAAYELLPLAYASYDALAPKTITNKALTSNVATITTATVHGLIVGNNVLVDCSDNVFDGTFTVLSVPTTTTFTYAKTNANIASAAATGTVVGPEVSYDDLLAGYDSLATTTSFAIDTTNKWMTIDTSSTTAPWLSQVSTAFFPVIFNAPYSARIEAISVAGSDTKLLLRFKWYTAANAGAELPGTAVLSPLYSLTTTEYTPCVIGNATPPAGALFGRLVLETSSTVGDHTDRIRKTLIEDAPTPGVWFDGRVTDGAYGDYRFTGTADQSYSAYYMNFNAVLNGLSSSDRVRTAIPALIPPERDWSLNTVLNGLL